MDWMEMEDVVRNFLYFFLILRNYFGCNLKPSAWNTFFFTCFALTYPNILSTAEPLAKTYFTIFVSSLINMQFMCKWIIMILQCYHLLLTGLVKCFGGVFGPNKYCFLTCCFSKCSSKMLMCFSSFGLKVHNTYCKCIFFLLCLDILLSKIFLSN